ncbi:MAG: filamentous hemagglutinin N-terminal domain-containing protein, partial [Spirulina sp.]
MLINRRLDSLERKFKTRNCDRHEQSSYYNSNKKRFPWLGFGFTLVSSFGVILTSLPTSAQIASDGTLNTTVTGNPNFTITGGNTAGTNLFHSFSEFSVPSNGSAFFNNATNITNIFSRVTGDSASVINGLIRANGTANLFLLNPNGIQFGSGAQLQLGGSFFATTADSLQFADGSSFSAVDSQTPLLTISAPVGLVFGDNPGAMQVQGSTLEVDPGQTLALLGGEVRVNGGTLKAKGGRMEVGGVAAGQVSLQADPAGFALAYDNVQNFRDIQFSQKS